MSRSLAAGEEFSLEVSVTYSQKPETFQDALTRLL